MTTTAKFPPAIMALSDVGGDVVNFGELVLNTSIISSTTSIVATTGIPAGWPQVGFITIDSEVIKHTSWTGSTFTTVVAPNGRGFDGTTAGSHTAGAAIKMADTALRFNQVVADLISAEHAVKGIYSVTSAPYNAVGDGVANDTAAIQAAIDAAGVTAAGGIVYFPPGTYRITTTLSMRSNVKLLGAGRSSTIDDDTGNLIMVALSEVTGCVIESLRFTGQGALGTAGRGAIWAALTTTFGTRRTKILNNFIETVGTCGIVLADSQHCIISGNEVRDPDEHGIYLSNTTDTTVSSNIIVSPNATGIKLSTATTARITLSANVIETSTLDGILVETPTTDVTIKGNVIRNTIERSIRVNAGASDICISGNTIVNPTLQGIRLLGGTDIQIVGNLLDLQSSGNIPIYVDSSASEVLISGNQVDGTPAGGQAMFIDGDRCFVTGNYVSATNDIGIQIGSNSDSTRVVNNQIRSATPYSDSGTNTTITDAAGGLFVRTPTPLGYATGAGGAVTQITSSSTSVTLNKPTGQITTVSLTTAAGAEERFTVNNTSVAATDTISLGTTYNGAGTPAVSVLKVGANLFDIVITNLHSANALNAVMVINFAVIKAVAA